MKIIIKKIIKIKDALFNVLPNMKKNNVNKMRIAILCFGLIIFISITYFISNKYTKNDLLDSMRYISKEKLEEEELTGALSYDSRKYVENVNKEDYLTLATIQQNIEEIKHWGICRMAGHVTPNADPGTPELISKYNGVYLGDTSKKEIYLTFDEGYENGYTPKILDVLKENNVRTTFFITGSFLKTEGNLVKRMVEEGHIVGNHTINHPSLPTISDKEIEDEVTGLDKEFFEKFNKHMTFFRPPKGEYNERTLKILQNLGYKHVFWSFAYDDWYRNKVRGADYASSIVAKNLHNGAIILLHAVSKDNAEALDQIIKLAKEKGFEFRNLDQLP